MTKREKAARLRDAGLSNSEIAKILGVPVASARRLVSEGRAAREPGHARWGDVKAARKPEVPPLEEEPNHRPRALDEFAARNFEPTMVFPTITRRYVLAEPENPLTILVIPDTQCKPDVPLDHLYWAGRYIAEKQPDVVIHLGDHWDMPSLSSYEGKGSRYFEGKRVTADIAAGNRGLELLEQGMGGFKPKRKVLLRGNHESVSTDTEVLTREGWVPASLINGRHEVASFSKREGIISFERPLAISYNLDSPLLNLRGDNSDEMVSSTHHFVVNGERIQLPPQAVLSQDKLRYAGFLDVKRHGCPLTPNQVALMTWVICDGTVVLRDERVVKRIQFRLSRPEKITALKALLDKESVPYTEKPGSISHVGKMPVTVIRIYGEWARTIAAWASGKQKLFPDWICSMPQHQFDAFLSTLLCTDGCRSFNHINLTTIDRRNADMVQLACIFHGVPCRITARESCSGFSNGKAQYHLSIFDRGLDARRKVNVDDSGHGPVVSISTKHETLITRRNGKVSFTGNSRITRAINEDPRLEGLVGFHQFNDVELGWEPIEFLEPIEIAGVWYSHYFPNPMSGRPYSGNPETMLKGIGFSFTQGHQQGLRMARRQLANGVAQRALIAGSFYQHHEAYLTIQGNHHWRGIIVKHEARDGDYDIMEVSLDYLKKKFG